VSDPKYEFRAPKYIDFLGSEDPNADRFFDCRISLDKTAQFDDPMDALAQHELQPTFEFVSPKAKGMTPGKEQPKTPAQVKATPGSAKKKRSTRGMSVIDATSLQQLGITVGAPSSAGVVTPATPASSKKRPASELQDTGPSIQHGETPRRQSPRLSANTPCQTPVNDARDSMISNGSAYSTRTVESTPSSIVASGVKKMRLTIPKTPTFATEKRAKLRPAAGSKSFEQMQAEKAARLERKKKLGGTIANAGNSFAANLRVGSTPAKTTTPRATEPSPFSLHTADRAKRSRSHTTTSADELECTKKFKARRLDQRVLEGVPTPVHTPKQLTRPEEFRLSTSNRHSDINSSFCSEQSESANFKALPLNRTIFQEPKQTPKRGRPLTRAKSPELATSRRASLRSESRTSICSDLSIDSDTSFHARPAPSFSSAPTTPRSNKPLTEPIPFELSTEKRGSIKKFTAEEIRMSQQAYEEEERKNSQFRARPWIPSRPFTPVRESKAPTIAKAPELHCERRAHLRPQAQAADMKEKENNDYYSRGHGILGSARTSRPYTKKLTEPVGMELESTRRHEQKERQRGAKQQKELEKQRAKQEMEEARKLRDQMELEALRKSAVHKARPVPTTTYQPAMMQTGVATKTLTQPNSPMLQTRARQALKQINY
jgi:hypothetical protein